MFGPSEKKIILITGCSSGFGLHMAARLASKGHTVIATMRNTEKSGALIEEVKHRKAAVEVLQLDVTSKESIKRAVKEIAAKHGNIDVLINNAGCGMGGFFEDTTDEELREVFETNFFGVFNVIREVIPLMRLTRSGKIINISSISGVAANPAFGAYSASKWALEGLSESLYNELKFFGIDVHLIEPGIYKTKIFFDNARYAQNFYNDKSPYFFLSRHLEERMREHLNDCFKDPEEVAALAERIINSNNAPFRNIPDIESKARTLVKRFLPFRWYSAILRKLIFKNLRNVA